MAARAAIVVGVGAQSGLGAALARRFAREDLCVVLVGRTLERLELVATEIRANGGKARVAVADVTNEDEVTALFNTLEAPETLEDVANAVAPQAQLDETLVLRGTRKVAEQLAAAAARG